MRTRLFVVVALIAAAVGSAIPLTSAGASGVAFAVSRNAMDRWKDASSSTSAGSFVAAAGAPAGSGAYQMTTGPGTTQTGGYQTISNDEYVGKKLADLTELKYSSFEPIQNKAQEMKNGQSAAAVPVLAANLALPITTAETNGVNATLHFEPYYSTAKFGGHANPVAQHSLAYDTWQEWDALGGTWWTSTAIPGVASVNGCNDASLCYVTWNQIVSNNPDARIVGSGVVLAAGQTAAGAPWQNFRGAVDKVSVGVSGASITYDFEPVLYTSRPGSFQGWGANDSGASSISFADDPNTQRDLGSGSLHFANVTAPRADVNNTGWNRLKLTDLSGLSYDTYIDTPAATPSLAPELNLDCTGCGAGLSTLTFTPANNPIQGAVQTGGWQHWDARTGVWTLSGPTNIGQMATLDQWQAQFPLATIANTRLGVAGSPPGPDPAPNAWNGFAGRADALNIEVVSGSNKFDATYNFEGQAPSITSFNPTTGTTGQAVTITGTKFGTAGDPVTVKFNTTQTTGTVASATTINTTVPAGATTGVITVILVGGTTLYSPSNFVTGTSGLQRYEQSDPAFRYSGAGWQTLNDATESGGSALINSNLGSFVDVDFTGATIHWVGLRGPNTGVASVSIDGGPAATIDTYAPVYQPQQVLFSADGFTLGAHTMRVVYTDKNPSAAATSYIVVDAIETPTFQPTITGFTPQSGPPGTTVQINGSHLDGVTKVEFNGTNAPQFTISSPTSLTATVPSGATSGPIKVTAGTQTAQTATPFNVEPAPSLTLIRHEETDTSVFNFGASGGWFRWTDSTTGGGESGGAAMLNSASGSFVDVAFAGSVVNWIGLKGPNTAIAAIAIDGVSYGTVDTYASTYTSKVVLFAKSDLPNGAHTMRITYAGKNAAAATTSYLVVDAVDLAPPSAVITSFDPVGGPSGTVVTINGANLSGVTAVRFNGVSATFTPVSATQLTAVVPATATSGLISVTNGGGTTLSRSPFTVAAAPMHRFEQTATAFHYNGSGWFLWNDTTAGGGESGGSAQLTPTQGNFVDVTVSGDTVNLVGLRGPNTAIASISIDNVSFGSVDTYATTYSAQQVLFTATGLAPGNHTVRITYSGKNPSAAATSYLVVDAIEAAGTF